MFIYATTKDNSTNPIVIEGHQVFHDKDGAEYNKRAELALSILKTGAVFEKSKVCGYKTGSYIACQYITQNKDFAGRCIPITICMKKGDQFDMTAIHTLWEERYALSVIEVNEIQKCFDSLERIGKPLGVAKIIGFLITVLAVILIVKCCAWQ